MRKKKSDPEGPATKADIDALKKGAFLSAVIVPLVVACVTAVGTWVVAGRQGQLQTDLSKLQEKIKTDNATILAKNTIYGQLTATDEVDFFRKVRASLDETDTNFQAECYLSKTKSGSKLAESLETLRQIIARHPETIDEGVLASLRDYNTFVSSGSKQCEGGTSDQEKTQIYEESRKKLAQTRSVLRESASH